ncbi:MAG TPA: TonB-dependent receptor, partial [Rhodothermales bacterium]|nr:TonB-dependent receptor [Rhodothermales bacterium]
LGPTVAAQHAGAAYVAGRVVDEEGEAMSFVNVLIAGTTSGAVTDDEGRFRFATAHLGSRTLRATMVGYEPAESVVLLVAGDTAMAELTLREALLSLGESVVTASTYATGAADKVTLSPLEIITTPGASLDIFLAVKSFPGVASVDEGAGLFVRGGSVDETIVLLDGATVAHPYKYESPTGGAFGTIPPFLVSGTQFSSGGFSAKYGNALSGVLDMDSDHMPDGSAYTVNLGLGAASLAGYAPLIPGKLGVRFSGNRSYTKWLFRLNGIKDRFPTPPMSADANLSLIYHYSPMGRIKFFNFLTQDELGVEVREASYTGVYRGETANALHNLQWSDVFAGWVLKAGLSHTRYTNRQQLGNLDYRPSDRAYKARFDAEHRVATRINLQAGVELERIGNGFEGRVPRFPGVFDPSAPVRTLDEQFDATRAGAYANLEIKASRRLLAAAGVRVDHHAPSGETTVDPRLSARLQLSKAVDLRGAWGIYHQFPVPFLYNAVTGNPDLGAQRAQHFVGGLGVERETYTLRAEGYYKPYTKLTLRHETLGYTNDGRGSARGIDLFAKYGGYLESRLSGWVAYSYMQASRLQVRQVGRSLAYDEGPAPSDITHNLTVVGKARVTPRLGTSLTFRYATGRPVTPIIGAEQVEGVPYYLPIEGEVGSERQPSFQRLDAQFTYRVPFGSHTATLYMALQNALGRANVSRYEYSADYQQRSERLTHYRRFVYLGVMLNLNP